MWTLLYVTVRYQSSPVAWVSWGAIPESFIYCRVGPYSKRGLIPDICILHIMFTSCNRSLIWHLIFTLTPSVELWKRNLKFKLRVPKFCWLSLKKCDINYVLILHMPYKPRYTCEMTNKQPSQYIVRTCMHADLSWNLCHSSVKHFCYTFTWQSINLWAAQKNMLKRYNLLQINCIA